MGDTFNIGNVEKFEGNMPVVELSDISKIIGEMIEIKNDTTRNVSKKTRPYDIDEKTSLNCFSINMKAKIKKYHIDLYDVVEDAIICKEEVEAAIRRDLYDYYWDVYINVLISLEIDVDDYERIKNESDKIYSTIISMIDSQLFAGKQTKIETNKKITYLNAITAYVFYKCKFLIPIEGKQSSEIGDSLC